MIRLSVTKDRMFITILSCLLAIGGSLVEGFLILVNLTIEYPLSEWNVWSDGLRRLFLVKHSKLPLEKEVLVVLPTWLAARCLLKTPGFYKYHGSH